MLIKYKIEDKIKYKIKFFSTNEVKVYTSSSIFLVFTLDKQNFETYSLILRQTVVL